MAASYGFDISASRGERQGSRSVALLRLPRRRQGTERRGDVARADLDVPRRLLRARSRRRACSPRQQAQEIVDDFVIKLRIVRFLRTPEYDELFAGDPTWVTESIARDGRRRPVAGDEDQLPLAPDALQPRSRARAEPHDLVLAAPARWVPALRRQGRDRHQLAPVRERRDHAPRVGRRRRHRLLRLADAASASRCSSSARAPTSRSACSTRSTAAGTRSAANRSAACFEPVKGDVLEFDDVLDKFERMMDWLAGVYVNAMNIIHYMHDKYAYERVEMALHDYAPLRTMAFGMAGLSVVADSLSAISYAEVRVVRDATGLVTDYRTEGDLPAVRQQRQPRGSARGLGSSARS